ncbi:hypothetical protein ACFL1D_05115 [Candidatus Omnitrophota bacterium]
MSVKKTNNFAFLIHPPELKDVAKKYPFSKFLPAFLLKPILRILPPITGSQITGFNLPTGEELRGRIVICPLTAQQILDNPAQGQRKVLQAVRRAEQLGCEYIGLGAFTSIATDAGQYLVDRVKRISLTSGNAYAAALIIENLEKSCAIIGIGLSDSVLAIVGAAGSVGFACSKILSKKAKKIIFIDQRKEELANLVDEVRASLGNSNKQIESYAQPNSPIQADIVVTVASASEGIIKSEHLLPGTIVIDAAQPHNVAKEVIEERRDVLVMHSGIAFMPGINLHMDVGIGKEEVYACLGEVLILAWRGRKGHYSLGKVDPRHVEEILEFAPRVGLRVASFRNQKGKITEDDFQKIKTFRSKSK